MTSMTVSRPIFSFAFFFPCVGGLHHSTFSGPSLIILFIAVMEEDSFFLQDLVCKNGMAIIHGGWMRLVD